MTTNKIKMSKEIDYFLNEWFDEVIKYKDRADKGKDEAEEKGEKYREGYCKGYGDGLIMATSILSRREKQKCIKEEMCE